MYASAYFTLLEYAGACFCFLEYPDTYFSLSRLSAFLFVECAGVYFSSLVYASAYFTLLEYAGACFCFLEYPDTYFSLSRLSAFLFVECAGVYFFLLRLRVFAFSVAHLSLYQKTLACISVFFKSSLAHIPVC